MLLLMLLMLLMLLLLLLLLLREREKEREKENERERFIIISMPNCENKSSRKISPIRVRRHCNHLLEFQCGGSSKHSLFL